MKRAIVEPAELARTALDELKQWLAITTPKDDALLVLLMRASLDMCESFTGTMPLEAQCETMLPADGGWHRLSTRPVRSITTVNLVSPGGERSALPVDAYAIDIDADGSGKVRLTRSASEARLAVRFSAGLAPDWGGLPEALRHGIIRLAAHHYRTRDTGPAETPPAAVAALWRPWRRMRLI